MAEKSAFPVQFTPRPRANTRLVDPIVPLELLVRFAKTARGQRGAAPLMYQHAKMQAALRERWFVKGLD